MELVEKIENMERIYSELDSEMVGKIFKRCALEKIKNSLSIEQVIGMYLLSRDWEMIHDVGIFSCSEVAAAYGIWMLMYAAYHDKFMKVPRRILQVIEINQPREEILRAGINREMLHQVLSGLKKQDFLSKKCS